MSAFLTASLVMSLLVSSFSVSVDQRNITVQPGDNVILTRRAAENDKVKILEWIRTDRESDPNVLVYRDDQFDPELQSLSFRNRVSLLGVKNGDVSFVLKNVTTDDTGTYACRVVQRGKNRRKRSILKTDPISIINLRVEAGQRIITVEPGDNVILPCRAAENKDVRVVKWSRTDLESDQYVLLYNDSQSDPELQSPSFKNRVFLLDVENGDVSLVLKNMTTDDTGTYECRVVQRGNIRSKRSLLGGDPISSVNLNVKPGNEEKLKEDGGNKGGPKEDGGSKTGLIVGLSVFAVVVVGGAVSAVFYKRSRDSSPRSNRPPAAAADAEETLTGPDE